MSLVMIKTISLLALPPGLFIFVGLLGCLFYRNNIGRFLIISSFVLLWLMSTVPVRDTLSHYLESQYPPLPPESMKAQALQKKSDTAIVVLGAGIYADASEYGGVHSLRDDALMRTLYAAQLAKTTHLQVYTSGGKVSQNREAEADVMRRVLIDMGVDKNMIFTEVLATNTWENARNIKAILSFERIKRVVLVTSASHMPRAIYSFREHGLDTIPAPCAYRTSHEPYQFRDFLPSGTVLGDSTQALHEYLGLIWYQIYYDKPSVISTEED